MKKLIFSPKATSDIDRIYDYTADNWGVDQAEDYTFAIRDCCQSLAKDTKRGRLLDSVKAGYLALSCQSHFIIYKSDARVVTVIRILHRRMNLAAHL